MSDEIRKTVTVFEAHEEDVNLRFYTCIQCDDTHAELSFRGMSAHFSVDTDMQTLDQLYRCLVKAKEFVKESLAKEVEDMLGKCKGDEETVN